MLLSFSFPINFKPRSGKSERNRRGERIKGVTTTPIGNKLTDQIVTSLKLKFNARLKNQELWSKEIEIVMSDVCLPIVAL